jgi:GTP cyclohydrolase IA
VSARVLTVTEAWRCLFEALGYDPEDPHLADSPGRIARFMAEWHTKEGTQPPKLTTFPNEPRVDELVAVGGLQFHSMCAHHGLPFFGTAAIGYIPGDRILGLSKFARVVDHFSRRFQVQERLTSEVATYLAEELKPKGLGVVMQAEHLCMSMRGIRARGHFTVTSDLRGAFRDKPEARAELLTLLREGARP